MKKKKFKIKLGKTIVTKENILTKIFEDARKRIKKEKGVIKK